MSRKKIEISAETLLNLARSGKGRGQCAEHFGLSYSGFCSRLDKEPELREAFEDGVRLHREDLYSQMVSDFQDPECKPNIRAQIFDKVSRWGDQDRTRQIQQTVLGGLTDQELVALKEALLRRRLEDRLGVGVDAQAHEPKRQKLATGPDVEAEAE